MTGLRDELKENKWSQTRSWWGLLNSGSGLCFSDYSGIFNKNWYYQYNSEQAATISQTCFCSHLSVYCVKAVTVQILGQWNVATLTISENWMLIALECYDWEFLPARMLTGWTVLWLPCSTVINLLQKLMWWVCVCVPEVWTYTLRNKSTSMHSVLSGWMSGGNICDG